MAAKKHVIFLGAGASSGSGYPLANELRLLMSSRKHLENRLADYEGKHRLQGRPIVTEAMAFLDKFSDALDLFRNGGFATLDASSCLVDGRIVLTKFFFPIASANPHQSP
jgi:hypothetical protein